MQINKLIAIYGRVSTVKQEEEGTIETQLLSVREYAEKNGYKIIEEYIDDGWSGDVLVRPELDRLRVEAKNAKWEAVLMYDPDRLARRYSYQEYVKDELVETGKEVLFVTMTAPKNSEDKILNGVRGLFAEYERVKITERMRLGKLRKVKQNKLIGGGEPLYGYTYIPNSGTGANKTDGYYVINEGEAEIVRMVFNWVGNEGYTVQKVIKKLLDLDIKPRKSKRGVWANSTLNHMLKNEGYIGNSRWNSSVSVVPTRPLKFEKYKKNKKTSKKDLPKSDWLYVNIPPIISKELFDKTREQVKSNWEKCRRNRVNEYLLSGILFCTCGKRRTGEGAQKNKHLYYRCIDRVSCFPLPRTCNEMSLQAPKTDNVVWEKVSSLMTDRKLLESQLKRWIENKKTAKVFGLRNIEEVEKELNKLKDQEDRYNKGYGAGVFSLEQLAEYQKPIKEKLLKLDKEIQEIHKHNSETRVDTNLPSNEALEQFCEKIKNNIDQLSFIEKRSIIEKTVQRVEGTKQKLIIKGCIPLNTQNYVESQTSNRNCGFTKCGEEHSV